MNVDTVLKCAYAMAEKQMAGMGYVTGDVQSLIDELTAPVVEEPAPKSKKAQAEA